MQGVLIFVFWTCR